MDSLFDQSALIALAERLVKAARAAGADAADAVAMRSVSQSVEVRDGAVEESRALRRRRHRPARAGRPPPGGGVDQRPRAATASRRWPSARWRWRGSRPRTSSPAWPIPALLARSFPDLDLLDPRPAGRRRRSNGWRAAPRRPASRSRASAKSGGASASAGIGGMVLVTSHGFSGAYLGSRHGVSMTAIAGEGTAMETRLRLLLGAACRRSRCAGEDRPHRRRARGRAAQSAQGLDPQGAGGVRPPRVELAGRPSRQRHQRQLDRAQDQLPQGQARRAAVRAGHQHHRRSAAPARPALAAVRRRGRRRHAAWR